MISTRECYKKYSDRFTEIENYEKALKDPKEIWVVHHRLETHFSDGTTRPVKAQLTKDELIALDVYYNRPPEELIFLTRAEHAKLHYTNKPRTEDVKQKISRANKGKPSWNKGKSAWNKGLPASTETREKLSEIHKGKHWFNNGTIQTFCFECPEGFAPGMLKRS